MSALILAILGTGISFAGTVLGSGMVFLFRHEIKPQLQKTFLGFAAGVMIAASVWSLLIPAMEMAGESGMTATWLPAAGGFVLGALFLLGLDSVLPHMHSNGEVEGMPCKLGKNAMLLLAVTLHNIPEGLAVGLAFGMAAQGGASITLSGALTLAVGMALQNFPEGAAISLPLKDAGNSNRRSFVMGALSGAVEPVAGVIGVLLVGGLTSVMPWMLGFAAGAMIYVVVEELIPEASMDQHNHLGTLGAMGGFLLMMVLDVALG